MLVYVNTNSSGWIDEDKVGTVDERPCLSTSFEGGRYYANMMNPDGSIEKVFYDDSEYSQEARIAKPVIDATEADYMKSIEYMFENWLKGHTGIMAKTGVIVRVVKGRKVPIGTEFEVTDFRSYEIPRTYGHKVIRYLEGTLKYFDEELKLWGTEKVSVNADNVILVGINMKAVKLVDWYF